MRLDALLVDAAVRAGATLIEDATAVASRAAGGRVTGATFRRANGPLAIDAQFTLLATGANATIMSAFGLSPPMKPNAVAGRAYYQVPPEVADQCRYLCIAYDRPLCPGYGWIFPGPDNRFNVGVGLFSSGVPGRRLQDVWRRFITKFEPAAAIVRQSAPLTEFKGAPMRTGLAAGPLGKPGLLVVGEAAATTYPATGEGIGKAMESGLLAARLVSDAIAGRRSAADLHQAYESEFREQFFPRYRAYGVAQAWSSHPWMLNILARRAHAGSFVRTELESLIAEQDDPSRLFSAKGLLTLLFH
jgi:flavin-dependent dehydrogenase